MSENSSQKVQKKFWKELFFRIISFSSKRYLGHVENTFDDHAEKVVAGKLKRFCSKPGKTINTHCFLENYFESEIGSLETLNAVLTTKPELSRQRARMFSLEDRESLKMINFSENCLLQ